MEVVKTITVKFKRPDGTIYCFDLIDQGQAISNCLSAGSVAAFPAYS